MNKSTVTQKIKINAFLTYFLRILYALSSQDKACTWFQSSRAESTVAKTTDLERSNLQYPLLPPYSDQLTQLSGREKDQDFSQPLQYANISQQTSYTSLVCQYRALIPRISLHMLNSDRPLPSLSVCISCIPAVQDLSVVMLLMLFNCFSSKFIPFYFMIISKQQSQHLWSRMIAKQTSENGQLVASCRMQDWGAECMPNKVSCRCFVGHLPHNALAHWVSQEWQEACHQEC